MPDVDAVRLTAGRLSVDLDRRGAVIAGFVWQDTNGIEIPLMRNGTAHGGDPLKAACFPLLPFCNRVLDNRFSFAGREYEFQPNQPWDRHYLHGDGWLSRWSVSARTDTSVGFAMTRSADPVSPYAYAATIDYTVTDRKLVVALAVTNQGGSALPFGLGLHPYFPLTPATTLQAPARGYYPEEAEFMPGVREAVPPDLDFRQPTMPPRRWINNWFAGWNGTAEIVWPERQLALAIEADLAFEDYFVFMSDRRFEPDFAGDYFCFEPMTHAANAHRSADLAGLVVLAPGETLSRSVSFRPREATRLVRNDA